VYGSPAPAGDSPAPANGDALTCPIGSFGSLRVSGSRTVSMFVLPRTFQVIDTVALVLSLNDSAARQAIDYARVQKATVAPAPPAKLSTPVIDPADTRRFAEEELGTARPFAPDAAAPSEQWLTVEVLIEDYLPGSRAYLVITSDPLVIASAVVAADGTARLVGAVPLEVVGEGAHRLRVVGSRYLPGVSLEPGGGVHVEDATMREIQTFDRGTTAVVEISGVRTADGLRRIVRYIPLRGDFPLWLLVAVGLADAGAVVLRRRRHLVRAGRRWTTLGGVGFTAVSAGWLGWIWLWPEVAFGCAVLFLVGTAIVYGRRRHLEPFLTRAAVALEPILARLPRLPLLTPRGS
jgi:hypothetical protein